MSGDVIHGVMIERDCRNCDGSGWKGYFFCRACSTNLAVVGPAKGCSHPPGDLSDNRKVCDTCGGNGKIREYVPASTVVVYLWPEIRDYLKVWHDAEHAKTQLKGE